MIEILGIEPRAVALADADLGSTARSSKIKHEVFVLCDEDVQSSPSAPLIY